MRVRLSCLLLFQSIKDDGGGRKTRAMIAFPKCPLNCGGTCEERPSSTSQQQPSLNAPKCSLREPSIWVGSQGSARAPLLSESKPRRLWNDILLYQQDMRVDHFSFFSLRELYIYKTHCYGTPWNNYYLSGELTWHFSKKVSIRSRRIGADGRHLNLSKFLASLQTPLALLFSCHFLPPLLFFLPSFHNSSPDNETYT